MNKTNTLDNPHFVPLANGEKCRHIDLNNPYSTRVSNSSDKKNTADTDELFFGISRHYQIRGIDIDLETAQKEVVVRD